MSVSPDLREKTVARKTVPTLRRTPRPVHPPRWLLPAAIGLFAVVAVVLGISMLRSGDDTTTAFEPLIVPEEQAFIDARVGQFGRSTVAATALSPVATPDYNASMRPTGVDGMIGYYESEYIMERVPMALLPSPASVGFPQLVGEFEQGFIDARTAALAFSPVHGISMRPTGVDGMIGYYESEYILERVPMALLPSPASVGFPQLIGEFEQGFIDGAYPHPWALAQTYCDTHTTC